MKNAIMYYYQLNPTKIHQTGKNYYFVENETTYLLLNCVRPFEQLEEIYGISEMLYQMNFPVHRIIKNMQDKLFIEFNDNIYVLLEVRERTKETISLGDILSFQKIPLQLSSYKYLYRKKWDVLWSSKIDYFEYQVNQFGKKYPIIRESFSYFCGLAENAISYAHLFEPEENVTLAHQRIKKNMTLTDLYNPLSFVIDDRTRDITEYFKDKFFNGYLSIEEVKYYLEYRIQPNEFVRFYTRMLYPSFYFDVYEEIMRENKNETLLLPYIHKATAYEGFLFDIWIIMNEYTYVPKPEWIQKKES